MLLVPGQGAADLSPINQRNIQIPIRFDPDRRGSIKELLLFISKNQGERWEQTAIATPDKDHFAFLAPADGVYWFNMMVVDKDGRRDPADLNSAPPGLKVLIDTQPPLVTIKSAERINDEVVVSWDIQEQYADLAKLRIEYRGAEGNWLPVDARPGLSGTARFRPLSTGASMVRVQLHDLAGNRGEQTRDVAAAAVAASQPSSAPVSPASNRITLPDLPLPGAMDPIPSGVKPAVDSVRSGFTPIPMSSETQLAPRGEPSGQPLAVSSPNSLPATGPLPNAQVINVAKFDLAFDVEQRGPSGVSKSEVWVTRDDGRSWLRWQVSEKGEAPITVDLDTRNNPQLEGVYGFKIVLASGAGLSRGAPAPGDLPDMRVDVDLSPPVVKIYEPLPDPAQKDAMILRWQAVDRNMAVEPIAIEWSENADGPWHPVAGANDNANTLGVSGLGPVKRLANTGSHSWKLPSNFPAAKVFLKVSARDTAGNVAEAKTPSPIIVDLNRPVAKIQGIVGTSSQKR